MNISVNSPSYKRPNKVRTLDYLPFCKVWVDESEYGVYKTYYPDSEIISCPKGIQGNVARVRNYILKTEFEKGADVVVLVDDDLFGLFTMTEKDGFAYTPEKIKTDDFLSFVEKYTEVAEEVGAKLWGVNLNYDAMAYDVCKPFSLSSPVLGPFQCFLKGNECWYDENLPLKEDYDMSLQQLNKYRRILRLNFANYRCEQSVNAGGCAVMRNRAKELQQLKALQKKWGKKIVQIDTSNKSDDQNKPMDYNPRLRIPI